MKKFKIENFNIIKSPLRKIYIFHLIHKRILLVVTSFFFCVLLSQAAVDSSEAAGLENSRTPFSYTELSASRLRKSFNSGVHKNLADQFVAPIREGLKLIKTKCPDPINKSFIALVGNTGSGKSTLVNKLCGIPIEIRGGKFVNIDGGGARIGDSGSETTLPAFFNARNNLGFVCDFPGLRDTRKSIRDVLNAACIHYMLTNASSVKVIFLVSTDEIKALRGSLGVNVFAEACSMFEDIDFLRQRCALVVNKVPYDWIDTSYSADTADREGAHSFLKSEYATPLLNQPAFQGFPVKRVAYLPSVPARRRDQGNDFMGNPLNELENIINGIIPQKIKTLNMSRVFTEETSAKLIVCYQASLLNVLENELFEISSDVSNISKLEAVIRSLDDRNMYEKRFLKLAQNTDEYKYLISFTKRQFDEVFQEIMRDEFDEQLLTQKQILEHKKLELITREEELERRELDEMERESNFGGFHLDFSTFVRKMKLYISSWQQSKDKTYVRINFLRKEKDKRQGIYNQARKTLSEKLTHYEPLECRHTFLEGLINFYQIHVTKTSVIADISLNDCAVLDDPSLSQWVQNVIKSGYVGDESKSFLKKVGDYLGQSYKEERTTRESVKTLTALEDEALQEQLTLGVEDLPLWLEDMRRLKNVPHRVFTVNVLLKDTDLRQFQEGVPKLKDLYFTVNHKNDLAKAQMNVAKAEQKYLIVERRLISLEEASNFSLFNPLTWFAKNKFLIDAQMATQESNSPLALEWKDTQEEINSLLNQTTADKS